MIRGRLEAGLDLELVAGLPGQRDVESEWMIAAGDWVTIGVRVDLPSSVTVRFGSDVRTVSLNDWTSGPMVLRVGVRTGDADDTRIPAPLHVRRVTTWSR